MTYLTGGGLYIRPPPGYPRDMGDSMYIVVNRATGQWLTGPIPYAEAATIARLSGHGIEEVEN